MAIQKYHTDGQLCPDLYGRCLRWHTKTVPVLNEGLYHWPDSTVWVDRYGDTRGRGRGHAPAAPVESEPEQPESPRASALNEARDLITGDRNNQYGPPTQDFDRTAKLLNAMGYARVDAEGVVQDILPSDVALIIAQVKVSRLMHSRRKRDSWVDLAGYAACGFECAEEEGKPGAS
jgi:hypothetical protein